MTQMLSRRMACGCVGGLFSGLMGIHRPAWAQTADANQIFTAPKRLVRPSADTDEGGLWALMDREEAKLKRSRFVLRDEALNTYVRDIVCKLGGEHCSDTRVYLVRNPLFNALMGPNGMMQVWTGLLLRVSNEAQLACVLGHEIGHYIQKHVVEGMRDARFKSLLATIAAGFGAVGSLAQFGLLLSMFSFTRDQERDADRIGIDLMAKAGYAPTEAARIWTNLIDEFKANPDNAQGNAGSIMFASHPPPDERETTLNQRATGPLAKLSESAQPFTTRYREALKPWRRIFAQDDLELRRFAESEALYRRFIREDPQDAEAYFFLAEVWRTRAREGDAALAAEQYEAAIQRGAAFAELARGYGLALRGLKRHAEAVTQFKRYLELAPQAADAALIESYITEMKS